MGLAARGQAVLAARLAFGGRLASALHAETGLSPFFLAGLPVPAAHGEMVSVAGLAKPPAGFFGPGAAFCAETAVSPKQAAFAGGLAVAGAAALQACRAVSGVFGRAGPAAIEAKAARGKPVPGQRGAGPRRGRGLRGIAGAGIAAMTACRCGRRRRMMGDGSRYAGHGRYLLLAERVREPRSEGGPRDLPRQPFPRLRAVRTGAAVRRQRRRRRPGGRARGRRPRWPGPGGPDRSSASGRSRYRLEGRKASRDMAATTVLIFIDTAPPDRQEQPRSAPRSPVQRPGLSSGALGPVV